MKRRIEDVMATMLLLFFISACRCSSAQDHSEVISSQCHQSISPVARAINDLGFSLSKEIGSSGNFFISPLSISVALAMTYLGARGQTAEQMENALGYRSQNLSATDVHEGFRKLITSLQGGGNEYSLLVANGMFIQENLVVNEQFVKDMNEIYQAIAEYVDFSNGLDAVEKINRWVNVNTRSKIQKLFEEPLDPLTRLVLMNAVYFKGTWKVQFPKIGTYEGMFRAEASINYVQYMTLHNQKFPYFDDSQTMYKFLKLPYKGEHISMLLALPQDSDAPADLILTSDILCRVNQDLKVTKFSNVIIPKFKMEYERSLKPDLQALGMKNIFTSRADLSGIREDRDLFVSKVIHKAVIEVNEEGSEAAAVTAVITETRMKLTTLPSFVANHPFLFYIIDNRSGVVIFSGRVINP